MAGDPQAGQVFLGGGGTESVISLLEKSIYDLLFLAHKFLALLQAVRLALDVNHSAVMQDMIPPPAEK